MWRTSRRSEGLPGALPAWPVQSVAARDPQEPRGLRATRGRRLLAEHGRSAFRTTQRNVRQWPEVYHLCHTFCTLRELKKPTAMRESHAFRVRVSRAILAFPWSFLFAQHATKSDTSGHCLQRICIFQTRTPRTAARPPPRARRFHARRPVPPMRAAFRAYFRLPRAKALGAGRGAGAPPASAARRRAAPDASIGHLRRPARAGPSAARVSPNRARCPATGSAGLAPGPQAGSPAQQNAGSTATPGWVTRCVLDADRPARRRSACRTGFRPGPPL